MSQPPGRIGVSYLPVPLTPPEIVEARRELASGGWRSSATLIVGAVEVMILAGLGSIGIWILPLLLVTWESAYAAPLAIGAALAALGVAAPIAWAEWVRRAWVQRRPRLAARVAPYDRKVKDPRWAAVQTLLMELRGPDPRSSRAAQVYRLALALADEFEQLERIEAAGRAGQALGEGGLEPLIALRAERDQALNRVLTNLKRHCAEALRGGASPEPLLEGILGELSLHRRADAEVEARAPNPGIRAARRQLE